MNDALKAVQKECGSSSVLIITIIKQSYIYTMEHHRREQQEVSFLTPPVGYINLLIFSWIANYRQRHARCLREIVH